MLIRQQPATDNQQSTAQPPIIVNVLPTPKTEEQTAEEHRERKEKAELDGRLVDWTAQLAFFTAGLFGATLALFLATSTLGYFAYRQSRDMRASIAIAKAANELNRENMIASQRAWLSIDEVKLVHPTQFTEEHMTFAVSVAIKNHGQTPATSVWIEFESYFMLGGAEGVPDPAIRFKNKLRIHPIELGDMLLPKETWIQRERWSDGIDKIGNAVRMLPSGEKMVDFMIFIGVSYRVAGDDSPHITYLPHDKLNVRIGFAVLPGEEVALSRLSFLAGIAD